MECFVGRVDCGMFCWACGYNRSERAIFVIVK